MNADAHAKNLSILYDRHGKMSLAPLHDLLCTRAYPTLDTDLAMAIGGEANPTELRRRHWDQLARDTGLGRKFVSDTVTEMAVGFGAASVRAAEKFRGLY